MFLNFLVKHTFKTILGDLLRARSSSSWPWGARFVVFSFSCSSRREPPRPPASRPSWICSVRNNQQQALFRQWFCRLWTRSPTWRKDVRGRTGGATDRRRAAESSASQRHQLKAAPAAAAPVFTDQRLGEPRLSRTTGVVVEMLGNAQHLCPFEDLESYHSTRVKRMGESSPPRMS